MKNTKTMLNEFKMQFPSNSINEGFARKVVSDFLIPFDPTLSELSDVRTSVSEAVTNSIVHAYKEKSGTVYISGKFYSDRSLVIKVTDKGCGIENVKMAVQPLYTTDTSGERGGMGFAIMNSFTDKLKIRSVVGKGTCITMIKKLHDNRNDGNS